LLGQASTYLHERGLYAQALPLAKRAVTATEVALGSGHVDLGWRIDELAHVLMELGDLGGARTQLERALHISETALGPDHPQTHAARSALQQLPPAATQPSA
jgi:hypothetical protein